MLKPTVGETLVKRDKGTNGFINRRTGLLRTIGLLIFTFLSVQTLASIPLSEGSVILGERPTLNGEPTVVEINLYVIDVDEIDDVNQRFSIDLFLVARWHDPRLALPEAERKGKVRFMKVDDIWTPRILLINDRGLTSQLRVGVEVDDFGNMKFSNRLAGELKVNLEFQQFPFDVQELPIDIVSYEYTVDEMQFVTGPALIDKTARFSIEGWQLKQREPVTGVFMTPVDKERLPRLTYIIEAKRDSEYYVMTLLVPMSLIIFMAWTVFWLQPNIVPPRIAISTASIFSLIALGVSIRLSLPKISYLTMADAFVLGCTLMVFIALAVAVIGSRWANSDRMEQALKINAIARWVYMLLFIIVGVVAYTQ